MRKLMVALLLTLLAQPSPAHAQFVTTSKVGAARNVDSGLRYACVITSSTTLRCGWGTPANWHWCQDSWSPGGNYVFDTDEGGVFFVPDNPTCHIGQLDIQAVAFVVAYDEDPGVSRTYKLHKLLISEQDAVGGCSPPRSTTAAGAGISSQAVSYPQPSTSATALR